MDKIKDIFITDNLILLIVTIFIISVVVIILVLNLIQSRRKKELKKILDNLEYEKNIIDSAPINPELDKVAAILKNEQLGLTFKEWKKRLENIKNHQIPKLTDMIIEADYSLESMDYKSATYKLAKLEIELYKVRANSELLLNEIKAITTYEEKSREIITNLKIRYRELFNSFNETRIEYGDFEKFVVLQFENIAKRFEDFENLMENNQYSEVTKITQAIEDMLKHMEIVTSEMPVIVLTATHILPKRIKEVEDTFNKLVKAGYPLDYLNVEYNVSEANKKIEDVLSRLRVLNLEDSLFELKVLLEYFDSLFNDFEKEKRFRISYEETSANIEMKLGKINSLVEDIFSQIDDIKNIYNLSKEDIDLLNKVRDELNQLNHDYKILVSHTGNNTFPYSKLAKEIEALLVTLNSIENRLDNSLEAIGSMREDEVRARQQLEEIKSILKDAKTKLRDYHLPVIPKSYYIELNEANLAIKEIIRELEKKPITISVLNTRVDTARDLVLKIYNTTRDMLKNASFAEMAIVYGNRYRTSVADLDKHLSYSEVLFFKGEYQKSLEISINSLNRIEPGIYEKLQNLYGEER